MDNADRIDEMIGLLAEVRNWLRVGFYQDAREALARTLNTDRKRRAYQQADGLTSVDAIRKSAGMSPNSVVDLFNACTDLGLMEVTEDRKRRRLFDLRTFGLLETDGEQ